MDRYVDFAQVLDAMVMTGKTASFKAFDRENHQGIEARVAFTKEGKLRIDWDGAGLIDEPSRVFYSVLKSSYNVDMDSVMLV